MRSNKTTCQGMDSHGLGLLSLPRGGAVAAVLTLWLGACSSSNDGLPKGLDGAVDRGTDTGKKDSPAVDSPLVCSANGQTYSVGQSYTVPGAAGACPQTCLCQATGASCMITCPPDGGTPDTRGVDGPPAITCARGGKSYNPGETIQLADGCGGWCVCLATGAFQCTDPCPVDGGSDTPLIRPEAGVEAPIDTRIIDAPPAGPEAGMDTGKLDVACTSGAPCTLGNGGQGLCSGGICRACAGAAQDSTCVAVYGNGTICADGQCVTGTCHDSTACTGSKVCDTTHTCHNCSSDLQCQNDTTYGRGTICLSNGQCVSGTCHGSADCQGKRLCDATLHTCSACTTDTQCQADTVYGSKSICASAQCVDGTCATSTDCQSVGRLCPSATKICTACTTDTQCKADAAYGASTICVDGQCVSGTCNNSGECPNGRVCNTTSHACVACSTDTQCKNDTKYGSHTICLTGACTTGDCHDISSDCSAGRVCGSTVPHACGDCSTDTQCRQDARYGANFLCVNNLCVQGNCHDTSNDCTGARAGLVCGATTAHTCGACANDDQCQSDAKYGTTTVCTTTAGLGTTGECVSSTCTNNNHACAANAGDFCCAGKCVAGNCCADSDCDANPAFGPTYFCRQNTCTRCDSVTTGNYLVDPVNGDDSMATGSGSAAGTATAGCSFRTLSRALAIIGTAPAAGTKITIVGSASGAVALRTTGTAPLETLPILVPANLTITTQTGPITLSLAGGGGGRIGFQLTGDGANLTPAAGAPLTIDGASHVSGAAITVSATGTVAIANVTIANTGDDAIQVTAGTVQLGAGVTVSGAGTTASPQNGLVVTGGTVNINNTSTSAPTVLSGNSQYGIYVSVNGVLNITGANTATLHSVAVQSNAQGNVVFQPTAVTTRSTIDGLYSSGSGGDGLRIAAGTNIRVRNSIFRNNTGNGIHIVARDPSATTLLANLDLGTAASQGKNQLQSAATGSANLGAGLCVDFGANAGTTDVLKAAGNSFANRDCSATNPGGNGNIQLSDACTSGTDLGITATTTATVNTDNCGQQ